MLQLVRVADRVVLILVFGAVVAGIIPIIMGIASIAVAIGAVALVGTSVDFSFFVTNIITMMGLAVGIDYSLFVVSRFREERANGRTRLDAIDATSATASRAVFFSGLTVVLALIGMLIVPTTIFRSIAAGAIFVVVAAVLASLTLLPALLSLLGDRVNSLRVLRRRTEFGSASSYRFWNAIALRVMGRPATSLVLAGGILIAASLSYFNINTGIAGASTLPEDAPSRQAFEVLASEFSGGLSSPVEVVIHGDANSPEVKGAIRELQDALAEDELFGPSQATVNPAADATIVSFPVNADPASEAATSSIARIRDDYVAAAFEGVDAEVLVGGDTAFNNDLFDVTDSYTPIVFVFVLGLSFLLLMVVFRSIVVPLKAIVMNLLSVGAAYGLIVLVFQEGSAPTSSASNRWNRSRRICRCFFSPSCSGCRWTITCSSCRGSRNASIRPATTRSRSPSDSVPPVASSRGPRRSWSLCSAVSPRETSFRSSRWGSGWQPPF
jgi:putative drug exporter of the RND superfamily